MLPCAKPYLLASDYLFARKSLREADYVRATAAENPCSSLISVFRCPDNVGSGRGCELASIFGPSLKRDRLRIVPENAHSASPVNPPTLVGADQLL